jgi:RNA polymerase sigma-70 factor (ECF subfamily)
MLLKLLRRWMKPSVPRAGEAPSPDDLAVVCATGVPDGVGVAPDENEVRRLVELLYPELRRIAQAHMRHERRDHTLQPTALVSEAFMKLAGQAGFCWRDRSHFLFTASKAMRLLLIDHARKHRAERHGGKLTKVELEDVHSAELDRSIEYLEVHELLKKLCTVDRRMAAVVELKVFGGLTFAEIGDILGVHERTVKRDWQLARAWLFGALRGSDDGRGMGADQDPL